MATRTFDVRTEPHRAVIGDVTLLFIPEASGAGFMSAYYSLQQAQYSASQAIKSMKASSTRPAKEASVSTEAVVSLNQAMTEFIRYFLVPESIPDFDGLRLPDRIMTQLIEFIGELYGGGSGNQDEPGGTSSD